LDFDWDPAEVAYREELQAFLAEELPDNWAEISKGGPGSDAQAAYSRVFCGKMAERGWLTQHWPVKFGGKGASAWRHAVLGEEMWRAGEPRGQQYMSVNWVGPTILEFGTEEQKAQHVTRIARGDALWCQGFSEPESGSDLASLRTQAVRDGDDYIVNGSKIWTSYVEHADYCFLLVRTDPQSKGRQGISVLLCPVDLPGIELREIPAVIGDRYFHEVFFQDVRVPVSCRLGPEGEGWPVVGYALDYERVGSARYARAEKTLDEIAAEAQRRGRLEEPHVQERLGRARAIIGVARMLNHKVIDLRAQGSPPTSDTNLARVATTAAERAVSELGLEIYGADAMAYGHFAEVYFRLAMWSGVAVGTTEINLNLVASRMLGLPRE
jgi:alkylation response protein AidB-like acyl-CoA dehydrogenase